MYHLTEESFDIEVLREKGAVVVMFYERWCPKCSMTKPIVEELEKKIRLHLKKDLDKLGTGPLER